MIEEMRTHNDVNDAVTITGIRLGRLLNALIELRWLVEDAGLLCESELLRVIGRLECTLLTNDGQLQAVVRDAFIARLRLHCPTLPAELIDRIDEMLS